LGWRDGGLAAHWLGETSISNLAVVHERHWEAALVNVELRVDQVNAALMSLQIIKAEEEIDATLLKHSEWNLQTVLFVVCADYFEVDHVDTSKNLAGSNTLGNACEPGVQQVHDPTPLSTVLANDSRLGTWIYECLDSFAIDFGVNVEHIDLPEEFWTVLECRLVVWFNQAFTNLFFDSFLGLCVVGVRILQLKNALSLFSLLVHHVLEALFDQFVQILLVIAGQGTRHFLILLGNAYLKVGVARVQGLNPVALLGNAGVLGIVEHLVEALALHKCVVLGVLLLSVDSLEKGVHQVLVTWAQRLRLEDRLQVQHVVVSHAMVRDKLVLVFVQNLLSVSKHLLLNINSRFNCNQTLQILDRSIRVNFDVVELIFVALVLDKQAKFVWWVHMESRFLVKINTLVKY
jgi:hypothetical protein